MINFGTVEPGSTLIVDFATFNSSGASVTMTGIAVTDVEIYPDGGTTQRASDTGYTLLDTDGIDIDLVTGFQGLSIDLSSNADAGFYQSGKSYTVVIASVTIDSQTVSFIAAKFRIGYPAAILNTTVATLSTQTSFTLTSGPAEDDALNGTWAIVHDVASAVQKAIVQISDYTGSTKTVTLVAGPTFTLAATDNISVMGPMPMQPATMGRQPVVDAAGVMDACAVKVGPSGSGTAQTAGDIIGDTNDIQSRIPAALVNGRMDSTIDGTGMESGAVTAIVNGVWNEDATGHQTQGTFGQTIGDAGANYSMYAEVAVLRNSLVGSSLGSVNDAAATTTSFKTTLTDVDDFFNDKLIVFTSGALLGQSRPILDFANTNGVITLEEALTSAPVNGVTFTILNSHVHPVSQIKSGLATSAELAKVPKSDGNVSWNATAAAQIQSEANDALTAYAPALASVCTEARLAELDAANLPVDVAAVKSDTAAILADTGTDGVVVASASKSGYALSATGLDSIAATDPGGVATTWPQMLVQLWRRFFKKSTLTRTQLKTYADDGTTVVTTQSVSDDGTTQTQGAAS